MRIVLRYSVLGMVSFSPSGPIGGAIPRVVAPLVAAALTAGCLGYNPSAKRWAYVGDTILVVGGGGVIAAGERLLDRVRSTLAATYPHAVDRRSVQIVGSPGGPEAGALGAALIAAG